MRQLSPKEYEVSHEEWEQAISAGRHNPARVLHWHNMEAVLSAGDSDCLFPFVDHGTMYVLIVNDRLGYLGLEAFDLNAMGRIGDVFFQDESNLLEAVGEDWGEVDETVLVKRLAEYLPY